MRPGSFEEVGLDGLLIFVTSRLPDIFHPAPRDKDVSMANRAKGTRKKASRTNEVAAELAQVARRMRQLVYGDIPEWGTKFTEIESQGRNVGRNKNRDSEPEVQHRDVIATSKNSDAFGAHLAARA